jgi:hypothetical protein
LTELQSRAQLREKSLEEIKASLLGQISKLQREEAIIESLLAEENNFET